PDGNHAVQAAGQSPTHNDKERDEQRGREIVMKHVARGDDVSHRHHGPDRQIDPAPEDDARLRHCAEGERQRPHNKRSHFVGAVIGMDGERKAQYRQEKRIGAEGPRVSAQQSWQTRSALLSAQTFHGQEALSADSLLRPSPCAALSRAASVASWADSSATIWPPTMTSARSQAS